MGFPVTAEQHVKACALGFPRWHERYGGPPGSGPEGKTCGSCAHKTASDPRRHQHLKCRLIAYTHGDGTSIKAGTPACHRYTPAP